MYFHIINKPFGFQKSSYGSLCLIKGITAEAQWDKWANGFLVWILEEYTR